MPAFGKTKQKYIQAFGKEKHGFFVRIPLPGKKTFAAKEFGSTRYTQAELMKQARAWRDENYFALYGHKILNRTVHKRQSNNRATGIPGVRRQIKTVHQRIGDRIYTYQLDYYIAEIWLEPGRDGKRCGKSRSKTFSVKKYSEETAFKLASTWRSEMEKRLLHDGPKKFEQWWETTKDAR